MKAAVSVAARRCACMDNFDFKRDIVIFDNIGANSHVKKLSVQIRQNFESHDVI